MALPLLPSLGRRWCFRSEQWVWRSLNVPINVTAAGKHLKILIYELIFCLNQHFYFSVQVGLIFILLKFPRNTRPGNNFEVCEGSEIKDFCKKKWLFLYGR